MNNVIIISLFSAVIALLAVSLPLIQINRKGIKRLTKLAIIVLSLSICFLIVHLTFRSNIYIPDSSNNPTVYTTRTGECYHEQGCRHLYASSHPVSLYKAFISEYRACSVCDPPTFDEEESLAIKESLNKAERWFWSLVESPVYFGTAICFFVVAYAIIKCDFMDKLSKRGHHWSAAALTHGIILYALFFFPAIIYILSAIF